MRPLISIIIPMYNVEKFIEDCLNSLICQNIEKEIIVIDDGSTDHSKQLVENYTKQYSYIQLLSQSNQGQGTARNIGLNLAQGEYIFFCDSDDKIKADTLLELYLFCKSNDLDILRTGWETFSESGDVKTNLPPSRLDIFDRLLTAREYFEKTIRAWYNVGPWNGIYKREFLIENNIFFPEKIQFEDNTFSLKLYLSQPLARTAFKNISFYRVRLREGSTTSERVKPKKIIDQLDNIKLMNEFISKMVLDDLKGIAKIAVSSLVFTMTAYYYRLEKKAREEIYKIIPKDVLKEAIKYPQSCFQKYKLILFV